MPDAAWPHSGASVTMPKCPRCDNELREVMVATDLNTRTAVEACLDGCAGIWVGKEDLLAGLQAASSEDLLRIQEGGDERGGTRFDFLEVDEARRRGPKIVLTPEQLAKYIACLRCGREMMRYRWNVTSPVILDECPDGHGIWIDAGEIMQMRQVLQIDTDAASPHSEASLATLDAAHQADIHARLTDVKRQFEHDVARRSRDGGPAGLATRRRAGRTGDDSPLTWLFGVLFDRQW